jgi:hypothetical protein
VLHHQLGEREALAARSLQRLDVGRVALRLACALEHRVAELLEEDLAELARRAEVELLAGDLPALLLELLQIALELARHLLQERHVEEDARLLHRHQHADERCLDLAVDALQRAAVELLVQPRCERSEEVQPLARQRQQPRVAERRLLPLRPPRVLVGEGAVL